MWLQRIPDEGRNKAHEEYVGNKIIRGRQYETNWNEEDNEDEIYTIYPDL